MGKGYETLLGAVREAFDAEALKRICAMPEADFHAYGKRFAIKEPDEFFYFKNNHSKILGVAHLDSVARNRDCSVVTLNNGEKIVFSPVLDDRLGVYVICELLPKLNIITDILLTTNEERGRSTAANFEQPHKQYNWMFQFDRKEDDVVMYRYQSEKLRNMLKAVGADPGYGSFSDICELEHLKCDGMNWGVGYQDYHSDRAYAWLEDTFNQVAKFVIFYFKHRKEYMEHKHYRSSRVRVDEDYSYGLGYGNEWQGDWWGKGRGRQVQSTTANNAKSTGESGPEDGEESSALSDFEIELQNKLRERLSNYEKHEEKAKPRPVQPEGYYQELCTCGHERGAHGAYNTWCFHWVRNGKKGVECKCSKFMKATTSKSRPRQSAEALMTEYIAAKDSVPLLPPAREKLA